LLKPFPYQPSSSEGIIVRYSDRVSRQKNKQSELNLPSIIMLWQTVSELLSEEKDEGLLWNQERAESLLPHFEQVE